MSKVKLGSKYFESDFIAVIEGEGKKHTKIWLSGSSPMDGAFLIPLPEDEVIHLLRQARLEEAARDLAQAAEIDLAGEREEREGEEGEA